MTAPEPAGDPTALEATADTVERAATGLGAGQEAIAAGARTATTGWTGAASSTAAATLENSAAHVVALAEACRALAPPLRTFAGELRAAQQLHRDAQARAASGRAAVDDLGSGAPAAADAERDAGTAAVQEATLDMQAAVERVRTANIVAARVVDGAAARIPDRAPATTPAAAPGSGNVAATLGNAAASVGNAALHHPLDVAALLGGGALAAVSAAGVAGSVAADATGVGTVVGLPAGAASVAGVGTGVGIAGAGALDLASHALTDSQVAPFQVNADSAPDADDPGPDAPAAERLPRVGRPGENKGVRELPDDQAVRDLFEELSEGSTPSSERPTYPGTTIRTSDGTIASLREESRSGGATIDATLPNGEIWKVHRPR